MNNEKKKEIKITYEEWIKNPFPQIPFIVDGSTKYIITNCPDEYAHHLKRMGIGFELKYPTMRLEEVHNPEGKKLVIFPRVGLTEDIFICDGKVELLRVVYHNKFSYYEYIQVNDKRINYSPVYSNVPYTIEDFPISDRDNVTFKKGDKFAIETKCEIKKLELYFK
jgi:hypothetical protein